VFCLRHHPHVVASAFADRPGVISFCLEDRASVDQAFALVGEVGWLIASERHESWQPPGFYGFDSTDLDGNRIRFSTRWFDLPELDGAERLKVPGFQGVEVGSYLYRPAPGTPPAALIMLHGHGGCATHLDRTARYFCDAGYLVLSQSLRGHVGTDAEDDQALYEVEDLKCAVEWLIGHEAIAASHIGLLGFSHGGQNVLCAGCRGARVGAIAACYAPTDMASWMAARPEIAEFMADVIEPDRLDERSAISMADAMGPPVLLIHGTEDIHVAYADTVRFKAALDAAGKPCELFVLEGESHFFSDEAWKRALQQITTFFQRHLRS
jgi:dipeptidyl aminopeptidase/acylaminoacyl peptidase